jgi:hypothetical protein
MINTLIDAIRLDIFHMNYGYSSKHLQNPSYTVLKQVRGNSILRALEGLRHINQMIQSIVLFFHPRLPSSKRIMFFADTWNNLNSMQPVLNRTSQGYLAVGGTLTVSGVDAPARFPVLLAYLCSLPFLPVVLLQFLRARGYRRTSMRYAFERYWITYGYYLVTSLWLKRLKPAAVVVANDHMMPFRVLTAVAHKRHIPTFYIPHASVSTKFPPLAFSYALLDGYDALHKYAEAGVSDTRVFLVGTPKADAYVRYCNTHSAIQAIGICTNELDPVLRVENLCQHLRATFPECRFILRPHPRDKLRRGEWQRIARSYELHYSESRTEVSFDFLQQVDAVLAGDSNILLEAAMLNVVPISYDFAEQHLDWYGFQRSGLAHYAATLEEASAVLQPLLQHKPQVRLNAKPYCATIGTHYDGRSSELASMLIQALVAGEDINWQEWRRIPDVPLEAFELVS